MEYPITLTEEEMQTLNLALGLAAGTAMNQKMHNLVNSIFALCNAVNRNNPNFTPYGIETQENPDSQGHRN